MNNQTNKKDPCNRGRNELNELLRSLWLGLVDVFQEEYATSNIQVFGKINDVDGLSLLNLLYGTYAAVRRRATIS